MVKRLIERFNIDDIIFLEATINEKSISSSEGKKDDGEEIARPSDDNKAPIQPPDPPPSQF